MPPHRASFDDFDRSAIAGRSGERAVTGDDRCPKGLGQSHVHSVVCGDVVAQRPGTRQQVQMAMAVEVEIDEIGEGLGCPVSGDFARTNQTAQALGYLDVDQMRRVEFVPVPKEPSLNPAPDRRL